MFTLYKIIGAFAAPPGLFVAALLLFALALFLYSVLQKKKGNSACASGMKFFAIPALIFALVLYFMSIPAGARLITGPLEMRYSAQLPPDNAPAAVLVLAGGSSVDENGSSVQPSPFSLERVFTAVKIARARAGRSVLILSGGDVYGANDRTEAAVLGDAAREMGWTGEVILEEQSRTTAENMAYSAEIISVLGLTRVIIVTNAFHMPRSMRLAERYMAGLQLYPAPGPLYTDPLIRGISSFLPSSGSLNASCMGIRERIGMLAAGFRTEN